MGQCNTQTTGAFGNLLLAAAVDCPGVAWRGGRRRIASFPPFACTTKSSGAYIAKKVFAFDSPSQKKIFSTWDVTEAFICSC